MKSPGWKSPGWLTYALVTTLLWGVWGAFTNVPDEHGFPATLIYVVWALTMLPVALFALRRAGWKMKRDRRSLALGSAIGLLGAGGQMALFHAVKTGAPYLVFPIVSLSPAVTIALSYALLKERTGALGKLGTAAALCSLPLFDYAPGKGAAALGLWFFLAVGVMAAWGVQAYLVKLANATMDAESIFLYMAAAELFFLPAAIAMTDFSAPIRYGLAPLAAAIQLLNSVGSLTLVYAFRHGKALVVSPLVNAGAPLLTSVIAMAGAAALPGPARMAGIALALLAALLLALQPEESPVGLSGVTERN
jgi:drug/metabolite transporter (DMT)-like permease